MPTPLNQAISTDTRHYRLRENANKHARIGCWSALILGIVSILLVPILSYPSLVAAVCAVRETTFRHADQQPPRRRLAWFPLFCTPLGTIVLENSMRQDLTTSDDSAALLRLASYLARPPKLMPVADERAEMQGALELVAKGSVVLTAHGEPQAAIMSFTTLEEMRRALLHFLVKEIGSSFERSRRRVQFQGGDVIATSEKELRALVGEVVKKTRLRNSKSSRKVSRG